MIAMSLILAASGSHCDRLPQARRLLEELQTQEALELVAPMRDDRRCPASERAAAWILSAEAWFALGEDPSARYSTSQAFALDPMVKPAGAVPEVLADMIEDQRQLQVGDTLRAQDRTGSVVDLSETFPIKVYVPSGVEPLMETRMGGRWISLTPRKLPGGEGRVYGAALPRRMMDAESLSYRFEVSGEILGPFQRRTAREQVAAEAKSYGWWPWVGGGVALGVGVTAAVLLMGEEEAGCQPREGTACLELRVRP
jgi:hypothetical protein